ncbi:hypothetical protein QOZ80_5BG0444030 [Eleusine coracana subsp. coracana]|nr:hypothetical protein QOZ80_5BG0444030 [Eleusine coracana subsp. coracana]
MHDICIRKHTCAGSVISLLGGDAAMEISSQTFLFAAALLLPFSWLLLHLLSGSSRNKKSNGRRRRVISIPSPPGRPITGHLHLLKKPLHRSLAALARRHDVGGTGLLRLRFGARPVVLVSSPAIADECFTVHDAALADRPSLASRRLLTGDDCPSISTASYGPLWRHLRRLAVVHALCAHRLAATAAARDAEARAMAAKLWRAAASGRGPCEVCVKAVAYEFVVNVIMAMVAGERMPEEKVVQFKEMTEAGFAAAGAANRQDFLPALRLLDVFGKTRKKLAGLAKARHQFGQSIVDDYRRRHRSGNEEETLARTVIGDLLRKQERSPESLDDVVIRTVCLASHVSRQSTALHTRLHVKHAHHVDGQLIERAVWHSRACMHSAVGAEIRPLCPALHWPLALRDSST